MSNLRTHDLEDIVAVTAGGDESPGNLVRHVDDKSSLGTVVAPAPRQRGFSRQPQVTVLWAREPIIVNISTQRINAKPRPMRAAWTMSQETKYVGDFNRLFTSRPRLEGEEEYDSAELSREQLDALKQAADNVTFHSDGRITVRRKADEPPGYCRGPDGVVRGTYFRR
jgi:hypothetical protein